jgi:hypothetical protein
MNKQDIIVPVFPGFYNTIYEFQHDAYNSELAWYLDNIIQLPDAVIDALAAKCEVYDTDYKRYEEDIGKSFCDVLTEYFQDLFDFEHFKITFKEIDSPSYYNYRNDKIIAELEYTDEEAEVLESYVSEHWVDWSEFVKEHFTSCDGFISFYDNDANEWPSHLCSMDEVESQYVLKFILERKCDRCDLGETLYYQTTDNIYSGEYVALKDSLIEALSSDEIKKELEEFEKEWDKCIEYVSIMEKQNPDKDYYDELCKKRDKEAERIVDKINEMMESF